MSNQVITRLVRADRIETILNKMVDQILEKVDPQKSALMFCVLPNGNEVYNALVPLLINRFGRQIPDIGITTYRVPVSIDCSVNPDDIPDPVKNSSVPVFVLDGYSSTGVTLYSARQAIKQHNENTLVYSCTFLCVRDDETKSVQTEYGRDFIPSIIGERMIVEKLGFVYGFGINTMSIFPPKGIYMANNREEAENNDKEYLYE